MAQPVWTTPAGNIATFAALIPSNFQLQATAVSPALSVTYAIISGVLPNGMTMSNSGYISGTPGIVNENTIFTFVVRATDNLSNIRDRTFTITISGSANPHFSTPSGLLLTTNDSVWVELPILYDNPIPDNPIYIRLLQGALPPGLEINGAGLIRGYPEPPFTTVTLPRVITAATIITSNIITCLSTEDFEPGREIIFSGSVFGGVTAGQTYYVKDVINSTNFTISTTISGPTYTLANDSGFMTITLPIQSKGLPTISTYNFVLELISPLGNDTQSYSITVENINTPIAEGGPGLGPHNRPPVIENTRPPTYDLATDSSIFGYYVLPKFGTYPIEGTTYPLTTPAYIGQIKSDNYFSFKMLGVDFEGDELTYTFNFPPGSGLTGNSETGWITGTPIIPDDNIIQFDFSVRVSKTSYPALMSPFYSFRFRLSNDIDGTINWLTDSDLGIIYNGTTSIKTIKAECDVPLLYRIDSGTLPPNLSLLDNGELTGIVAYQPTSTFTDPNGEDVFTFTIEAYSPTYNIVSSKRTFTLTILQEFTQPCDNLYIKCTPSFKDRDLIASLLDDNIIIPNDYLYRPEDQNFGKAKNVTYVHAYNIDASSFPEYVEAVTKNHYWRNITLGEISTAQAKNEQGEVIYEVVYSNVIDNLINPEGVSVNEEIFWPRLISLNQGPWYTSRTDIYTSFIFPLPDGYELYTQNDDYLQTQTLVPIKTQTGAPTFYTSLTPGYVRLLYPNSLPNMRNRVGQTLGQQDDFRLLPTWMTSQQSNGSTLGFTPAWVICYTKPGFAEKVKNNIVNNWKEPITNRKYVLNEINFQIDRFTVDKRLTYNYDTTLTPPSWTQLPSATPTPDPLDSKNFYVLMPRKTILPDTPQYY